MDLEDGALYDGCADEKDRTARRELLQLLLARGVGEEDLRRAVREERLALLPVELVLAPAGRYTLAALSERSGVAADEIARAQAALGLSLPAPDEPAYDDDDVELARALATFRALGLSEEGMLDVSRHLGQSMATLAQLVRRLTAEAVLQQGDSEADFGLRLAETADHLMPLAGTVVEQVLRLHIREGVRRDVVSRSERVEGRLHGGEHVAVAFADLVGFTRLGQQVDAAELGAVATRLADLARAALEPRTVLVKTIGDEVMLVSPAAAPLLKTLFGLHHAVEAEGEGFPGLRSGMAEGAALPRGGDWYGATVNLASRITGRARPGSILVDEEVHAHLCDEDWVRFSRAGTFVLKGVTGHPRLYRARPANASSA